MGSPGIRRHQFLCFEVKTYNCSIYFEYLLHERQFVNVISALSGKIPEEKDRCIIFLKLPLENIKIPC